jgi:anti-anti-sigma regulatory factor
MMRSCMDSVEVERGPDGTTVLLDRQLRAEPVLGPDHPIAWRGPLPEALSIEPADGGRLVVGGPVDVRTVDVLRQRLWDASHGGTLPLALDLGAVTHLASVGIALLYELVEEMGADGHRLAFLAPPGSPAAHALGLCGLGDLVGSARTAG